MPRLFRVYKEAPGFRPAPRDAIAPPCMHRRCVFATLNVNEVYLFNDESILKSIKNNLLQ